MIKIIKNNEIDNTRYNFYVTRCCPCREINNINILEISKDNLNASTIISLCDKCLQELKKKI